MRILIGVDEAGYGPHLGPLVVAATAWRVDEPREKTPLQRGTSASHGTATLAPRRAKTAPASACDVDLYKLLRKAVVRTPPKRGRRVAIADSKALYKSGLGLEQLERGVLAALALLRCGESASAETRRIVASGLELITTTGADDGDRRRDAAWHFDDALPLPVDAAIDELEQVVELLDGVCRDKGAALVAVRARLVFPEEFNALVDFFGNKSTALSHVTLELVRRLVDNLPTEDDAPPISIYFDKHGGRNQYGALLQHHFAECWIEVAYESRGESRYRWEHRGAPVEAVFRIACEELLPTALASMTAKYHRELAMRAFNAYWATHVPGLRPTAGYYGDSRRFRADVDAKQRELGIEDRVMWRCR